MRLRCASGRFGCTAETLRRRVREAEKSVVPGAAMRAEEAARVKALEREVRELRRANEILRKASACLAQAELDRPSRR